MIAESDLRLEPRSMCSIPRTGSSHRASACSSAGSSARSARVEADPSNPIFRDNEHRPGRARGAERVGVRWGRRDPTSPTPPLPPRFPPAETREGRGGGGEPGSHIPAEELFARVRDLAFCDLLQQLVTDPLHQLFHHLLVRLGERGRRERW